MEYIKTIGIAAIAVVFIAFLFFYQHYRMKHRYRNFKKKRSARLILVQTIRAAMSNEVPVFSYDVNEKVFMRGLAAFCVIAWLALIFWVVWIGMYFQIF